MRLFSSRHEACGEMKQSGWPLLLFREAAAVPVAVHEGQYGRNTVLSRPLQAPEKPISTVEYSALGNVLNMHLVLLLVLAYLLCQIAHRISETIDPLNGSNRPQPDIPRCRAYL